MSETQPTAETSQPLADAGSPSSFATVTTIRRQWAMKLGLIIVMFIGLGVWGLVDAVSVYPARGRTAASAAEYRYLEAARREALGPSITDPAMLKRTLDGKMSSKAAMTEVEKLQQEWLERLSRIGHVKPEFTTIPRENAYERVTDSETRFDELRAVWGEAKTSKKENPLAVWDIPSQWLIMAVGLGIGGYILVNFLRGVSRKYTWDPATNRLTLHTGQSITPGDLAEVDKRKWHKFYVTLGIKPGHETLGGKKIEIDLYRYNHLEEWILEMEKTAFPQAAEAQDAGAASATTDAGAQPAA
jgi:hypothetical protein